MVCTWLNECLSEYRPIPEERKLFPTLFIDSCFFSFLSYFCAHMVSGYYFSNSEGRWHLLVIGFQIFHCISLYIVN